MGKCDGLLVVTITVEGGVVQDVEVPPGVRVIVKDYDVEGMDEDRMTKDEDGNEYVESVYEE